MGIYPNEYEAQVAYVEYERVHSTKIVSTPSPSKNITTTQTKKRKSDMDVYFSNLVHEKVLLGWTPLQDEYCENLDGVKHAPVPLLLDHNGRKWSAVLNKYITEETLRKKKKNDDDDDDGDEHEKQMIRRLNVNDLYREMDRSRTRLLASNIPEECIAWARRIRYIADELSVRT